MIILGCFGGTTILGNTQLCPLNKSASRHKLERSNIGFPGALRDRTGAFFPLQFPVALRLCRAFPWINKQSFRQNLILQGRPWPDSPNENLQVPSQKEQLPSQKEQFPNGGGSDPLWTLSCVGTRPNVSQKKHTRHLSAQHPFQLRKGSNLQPSNDASLTGKGSPASLKARGWSGAGIATGGSISYRQ